MDFSQQFERVNRSRRACGQLPYASVAEYLRDQGFNDDEAAALAANSGSNAGSPLDAVEIYAKANAGYRETLARPGQGTPPNGQPAEAPPNASGSYAELATRAYTGAINARYRQATAGKGSDTP